MIHIKNKPKIYITEIDAESWLNFWSRHFDYSETKACFTAYNNLKQKLQELKDYKAEWNNKTVGQIKENHLKSKK